MLILIICLSINHVQELFDINDITTFFFYFLTVSQPAKVSVVRCAVDLRSLVWEKGVDLPNY